MSRRVSSAAAIGIALPSLLAGALLGLLLRSHASEAAAVAPPRPAAPAPRPTPPAPAPVLAATPEPVLAPASMPPARPDSFQAACRDIHEWLRGFDLKTRAGRERVRTDELSKRAAKIQQALMSDPEGYLAVLRSPENDDLFKFHLSLLCRVVGLEGGRALLPLSQYPKPILDGLRDLLSSGTSTQKLGILELVRREGHFKEGHLIGQEALVERCDALLSDADPLIRATAVQVLQSYASQRADRRFEVLQDVWRSSADSGVRSTCLQALMSMDTPAARDLLFKGITQITADANWSKDLMLQWSSIQAVQSRAATLKPEEEASYAGICSSALRSVSEPMWYQAWMDVSLRLPLARATPLLEQAQASAPTPALQASAQRVLEQIRAGETRTDRLQATLRKQY